MNEREKRQERVRAVDREYRAIKSAVELLFRELQKNPAFGHTKEWRQADATMVREKLEPTFVIRLYAEFEAGLREAWEHRFKKPSQPSMTVLLESIAAQCKVPQDWFESVQTVQRYRNQLVHQGDSREAKRIPFGTARDSLARFLSRLPRDWHV